MDPRYSPRVCIAMLAQSEMLEVHSRSVGDENRRGWEEKICRKVTKRWCDSNDNRSKWQLCDIESDNLIWLRRTINAF